LFFLLCCGPFLWNLDVAAIQARCEFSDRVYLLPNRGVSDYLASKNIFFSPASRVTRTV
jgi:hypothetical protein